MIKKIAIILVLMTLLASVPLQAEEMVFFTQDFSPFSYMEKGTVSGPAAAIIRLVCSKMNITPRFKLMKWRTAQIAAQAGKANALFVLGKNEARRKWMLFSPPIIETEYGFFTTKAKLSKIGKKEDLKGLTIGAYGPSNTLTSLNKLNKSGMGFKIKVMNNDVPLFKLLDKGEIDAVYSNKNVGKDIILKHKLKATVFAFGAQKVLYYIGFVKKSTDKKLVSQFANIYKTLYKKGEIDKIFKKFGIKSAKL